MGRAVDDFNLTTTVTKGVVTISVTGELDAATAPRLAEHVRQSEGDGSPDTVVVDLGEVTFIDSSGLSALVAAHKRFRSRGVQFAVQAPSPPVRKLFSISGLDAVLSIAD